MARNKLTVNLLTSLILASVVIAGIAGAPYFAGRIAYAVTTAQNSAERQKLADLASRDSISPLLRQVAKVVKPAVVEVRITKRVRVQSMPDLEDLMPRSFGDEPSMPRIMPRQSEMRPMRGLGSGVIVDAENGYIVTNSHVVNGADQVEVVTSDNRKLEAQWVHPDPSTDIAVVKVKPGGLIAAPLGNSDEMEVGDMVMAIGAPEELPQTVTSGIISAKGRTQSGLGGSENLYQNFLQTDAAINHGNSGGPLVNMRGEVVGINTAIVSRTGVNEGIGLAIPSNMVREIMTQLIDKGKVTRGYLGVRLQSRVDKDLARSFNLPNTEGALIAPEGVAPGSPADKAGLKGGDFIVAVSGKKIDSVVALRTLIAKVAPGTTVAVDAYRDGKKRTFEVKVEEQPKDFAQVFKGQQPKLEDHPEAQASRFGIKVDELAPELARQLGYKASLKGVLITKVDPASNAAEQGIKPGMVITEVNKKPVANLSEFASAIAAKEAADGVRLRVVDPQGFGLYVFVSPMKKGLNGDSNQGEQPQVPDDDE